MRLNPTTAHESQTAKPILNEELEVLIPAYGQDNSEKLRIEKILKDKNARIKELMLGNALDSYEAGGYKATCTIKVDESFNMDKLLSVIHEDPNLAQKVIKTQEYVDMDILEDLLYKGAVDKELMAKMNTCREMKETATLRVTKKKGGAK